MEFFELCYYLFIFMLKFWPLWLVVLPVAWWLSCKLD